MFISDPYLNTTLPQDTLQTKIHKAFVCHLYPVINDLIINLFSSSIITHSLVFNRLDGTYDFSSNNLFILFLYTFHLPLQKSDLTLWFHLLVPIKNLLLQKIVLIFKLCIYHKNKFSLIFEYLIMIFLISHKNEELTSFFCEIDSMEFLKLMVYLPIEDLNIPKIFYEN